MLPWAAPVRGILYFADAGLGSRLQVSKPDPLILSFRGVIPGSQP